MAMPARTHGHDTGAGRRCWAAGAGRAWARGRALQAVGLASAGRSGRAELAGAAGGARDRLGERQQARGAHSRRAGRTARTRGGARQA